MIFGYKPYLETERQSLDKKINEIGGAVSETDRENFIKFYSQLVNIQTLLNNHISGSNIYTFWKRTPIKEFITKEPVYRCLNIFCDWKASLDHTIT